MISFGAFKFGSFYFFLFKSLSLLILAMQFSHYVCARVCTLNDYVACSVLHSVCHILTDQNGKLCPE